MVSVRTLSAVLVLATSLLSSGFGQMYSVTDLGELPGYSTSAANRNSGSRYIAGISGYFSSPSHAFRWSQRSGLLDLGVLAGGDSSEALGVNYAGWAVGWASLSQPVHVQHAFLWTQTGGMEDLGTLPGDDNSVAYSVQSGIVVGYSQSVSGHSPRRGFVWTRSGGMKPLQVLHPGDPSDASSINSAGQIAGQCGYHACLWKLDGTVKDLGTLQADLVSSATAINGNRIVGYSTPAIGSSTARAFLWTWRTGMQDLGTLPGEDFNLANGVNASGTVVGAADLFNSPRGFVWTASTGMQDLNTLVPPEWNIWFANSINDRGEIVGTGVSRKLGGPHAVLLTPIGAAP